MSNSSFRLSAYLLLFLSICETVSYPSLAQNTAAAEGAVKSPPHLQGVGLPEIFAAPEAANSSATVSRYFNLQQGISSEELIRRALAANAELRAARLDIERTRARIT